MSGGFALQVYPMLEHLDGVVRFPVRLKWSLKEEYWEAPWSTTMYLRVIPPHGLYDKWNICLWTPRSTYVQVIGVVSTFERRVQEAWAHGIPALFVPPRHDPRENAMWLAEVVAQHLAPVSSLLPRGLGFRAYVAAPDGNISKAWWKWSAETRAQCRCWCWSRTPGELGAPYLRAPHWCGFHISPTPWHATGFYRGIRRLLVVAPAGRIILHGDKDGMGGARVERYDIVAVVAPEYGPIDEDEEKDPRFVRAQNLPLRAWRIAHEILACKEMTSHGDR